MNSNCPWGSENINLKNTVISSDEKLWLVKQVITRKLRPIDIHQRYNIDPKTFSKWRVNYRNGQMPQPSNKCRPKIVDDIGLRELKNLILIEPSLPITALREFVRIKSIETKKRRLTVTDKIKFKPASRRSVQRYADMIKNNAMEENYLILNE
jgi:transposase-like protein